MWNVSPSPLAHVSVTGCPAVSSGAEAVHKVSSPGSLTFWPSAADQPNCSAWMRSRAQVNAGEVYDMLHQRADALRMYRLAASAADTSQAQLARKYLQTPYAGK